MEGLRVYGTAGKATTRMMVDAIIRAIGGAPVADVLVLLSLDDAGRQAMTELSDTGRLVANSDFVPASGLPASAVTFGLGETAALRGTELDATIDGTTFTLSADGTQRRVRLQVLGEHHVTNALAALASAAALGISLDVAVSAIEGLTTLGSGRMQKLLAANDAIVINDAISSTPQSTAAALKALAQVSGGRRSIAVLGELSVETENSQEAHDRVGRLIVRLNVKQLIVVGQSARHIHNAAGLEGSWDGESVLVDTPGEAYDFLRDELRKQDVVLVKGSGLDGLAHRLAGATR